MANEMGTVRAVMTGFAGAPGLLQFRFQGATPGVFVAADASAAIAAINTFLTAIKTAFAGNVSIQIAPDVEVVDWATGDLVSVVAGTGVSPIVCTGTTPFLTAEGPLFQWHTGTVVGHRMLRGRTYIVPSTGAILSTTGQVATVTVAALQAAGNALAATAAVTLSIWHRPDPAGAVPVGTLGAVVSATVPLTVAVLRSRRD